MTPNPRSSRSRCGAWAAAAALLATLPVAAAAQSRTAIGVHGGWGVFRDARPPRCFAIAEPARRGGGGGGGGTQRPFASVAVWPAGGARAQLHVRLRRPKLLNAPITLAIGDRRVRLIGGGSDAWAPDWRVDRAIVAAMRGGTSMSIETQGRDGRAFVEVYALRGAATAIDAAALACR